LRARTRPRRRNHLPRHLFQSGNRRTAAVNILYLLLSIISVQLKKTRLLRPHNRRRTRSPPSSPRAPSPHAPPRSSPADPAALHITPAPPWSAPHLSPNLASRGLRPAPLLEEAGTLPDLRRAASTRPRRRCCIALPQRAHGDLDVINPIVKADLAPLSR